MNESLKYVTLYNLKIALVLQLNIQYSGLIIQYYSGGKSRDDQTNEFSPKINFIPDRTLNFELLIVNMQ